MDRFGFTGTRDGMTDGQKKTLKKLLQGKVGQFHHGDCVGADDQADNIAEAVGLEVHIHPSDIPELRAGNQSKHMYRQKPPLARNRDIVDAVDQLFACPKSYGEITRSGTWSTVRYARKQNKPTTMIWPDGSTSHRPSLEKPDEVAG